jgi:hypothetical protein
MMRLISGIALLAVVVSGSPAWGLDTRQSTLNQRQIRSCMVKRMNGDRALSYNGAKKTCADQLRAQSNAAAPPLAAASRQGS